MPPPCCAKWDEMVAGDRVRYCPNCNRDVYNFLTMDGAEIQSLVSHHRGRLCARSCRRARWRSIQILEGRENISARRHRGRDESRCRGDERRRECLKGFVEAVLA